MTRWYLYTKSLYPKLLFNTSIILFLSFDRHSTISFFLTQSVRARLVKISDCIGEKFELIKLLVNFLRKIHDNC